jgi:hypothetical protein
MPAETSRSISDQLVRRRRPDGVEMFLHDKRIEAAPACAAASAETAERVTPAKTRTSLTWGDIVG